MEVKNVQFSYTAKEATIQSLSTVIPKGKITTIIGPNGSGKSTLLQLLTKNLHNDKGQIIVDGKNIQDIARKELAKLIAVVHQHNIAPEEMTVEKLVYYGRLPYKKAFTAHAEKDEEIVCWALEAVGLLSIRDKLLHTLSGGQQQRVWIALSLAQKTPYIFLDEPTAALDIYYQYDILQMVKKLQSEEGMTVVMVLHDMNQAMQFSDHVIAMKNGEIVAQGNPEAMMTEVLIKDVYGIDVVIRDEVLVGKVIIPICS